MADRVDCVLDTHAWVWAVGTDGRRIGRAARRVLGRSEHAGVPAICQVEVANLILLGRMRATLPAADWIRAAVEEPPYSLTPLTADIAAAAAELGREGFHGDPADRMVYATARVLDAPLLTADRRIRDFERGLPRSRGRHVVWD